MELVTAEFQLFSILSNHRITKNLRVKLVEEKTLKKYIHVIKENVKDKIKNKIPER